jgi:hypothetical protein
VKGYEIRYEILDEIVHMDEALLDRLAKDEG